MLVAAEFVEIPRPVMPLSLALAPSSFESSLAGHVRLLSELRAEVLEGAKMIERGTFNCPCEIDLDLSKLMQRAGSASAFDFFFEPQGELETKLDVEIHRSVDGRHWGIEKLLQDCRPGIARTGAIRMLDRHRLRMRMRFVTKTPGAVRVWMREPARRTALARLAEGQHV